jgi:hypothetical protein
MSQRDDNEHGFQQVMAQDGHRGVDCAADKCAVCQFLGQKFIPAHPTQVVVRREFFEALVSAKPTERSQSLHFSWRVRAPPVV